MGFSFEEDGREEFILLFILMRDLIERKRKDVCMGGERVGRVSISVTYEMFDPKNEPKWMFLLLHYMV